MLSKSILKLIIFRSICCILSSKGKQSGRFQLPAAILSHWGLWRHNTESGIFPVYSRSVVQIKIAIIYKPFFVKSREKNSYFTSLSTSLNLRTRLHFMGLKRVKLFVSYSNSTRKFFEYDSVIIEPSSSYSNSLSNRAQVLSNSAHEVRQSNRTFIIYYFYIFNQVELESNISCFKFL